MDETNKPDPQLTNLTAEIVEAYVSQNSISVSGLPGLISSVHAALLTLGKPQEPEVEKPVARISVKKSVTPDYLISLEDGRQYKSLKRHLSGRDMTPDQYRAKWGLPSDYPMVAPNYAKQRSELARSMGLGRKRAEPEVPPEPAKRGRPKKAA